MSEIKFVKLSTQMFDDEKIKLIEQMPEADTLLIIWVKLLAQAGKTNASGYIFLSENVPYTDEMLAAIFSRPIGVVRMALETFRRFGMIEIDDQNYISICNWEKHQNVDALNKIREDTRKRVAKYREKQKALKLSQPSNVTGNVTVTQCNEQEEEVRSKKKELKDILSGNPDDASSSKKEKEEIPYKLIIDLLNKVAGTRYRHTTDKTRKLIKKLWKDGFRLEDFKHVILVKTEEWLHDPAMNKFLRPETLFGTKFESYLNQKGGLSHGGNHKGAGSRGQGRNITEDDIPY
ncbi:phage replisome organizer N-terminal domain-containing protein [Bacillus halotolerans]|uniref:phage replisome organizer N-terminal domain-containing protein n=1 Tax=Bacillus subtilis group TaxID=653685 RepID=UPI00100A1A88|nr:MULTISPECIES: phage replisome organizer N-terminal domain-containing protein [Bacillus subtilis group]MCY7813481.1 phage replisome organizer N-terminal domain-containing protein [Bacillus spizizenii]MBV5122213.1 phage replisome organizer N-terminal domain-containing protein [Bacillus halotolerans]MCC2528223.1 phage replisome organizer N-terminal domain-containing protein [Bacillus halotolerans]MCT6511955.1 phage replisome organizer N-terminal domain-containing protein [Bacillus subtilis]MCY